METVVDPSSRGRMDSQGPKENEKKLKLVIKFGRSIPVEITANSSVKDLKSLLQNLTNVLPRGQKLISKGKVLQDELTLGSSGIMDGSKIMLVASQGLHQGEGPLKEAVALPSARRTADIARGKTEKFIESAKRRWDATGIIALSNYHLTNIPEEVWTCGSSARVLDLSQNMLLEVPPEISCLKSLRKLLLHGNQLPSKSISWDGLIPLKSLTVLSLNQNNLTVLPSVLGALTSLTQLDISSNKLTCLPTEIGFLSELQILKAQKNRLEVIPTSIGGCASLVQVDLSCNLLSELPETFGNLKQLKALYVGNTGLKSLPPILFKMCSELSILDLHGTQITSDLLRQFEGWESFDERRRSKHQKQVDFRVTGWSGEFDEGADKNW